MHSAAQHANKTKAGATQEQCGEDVDGEGKTPEQCGDVVEDFNDFADVLDDYEGVDIVEQRRRELGS